MVRKANTIIQTLIKRVNIVPETISNWLRKQNILQLASIGVSFWDYCCKGKIP